MYICVTVNINETTGPLVLMVTQVGCDVLIDLGVWSFLFRMNLATRYVSGSLLAGCSAVSC